MEINWQSELVKKYVLDTLNIKNIEDILVYTDDKLSKIEEFISTQMRELQPKIKKKNKSTVLIDDEEIFKLIKKLNELNDKLNILNRGRNFTFWESYSEEELNDLIMQKHKEIDARINNSNYKTLIKSLYSFEEEKMLRSFRTLFKEQIDDDSLDNFMVSINAIQNILNLLDEKDQLEVIKNIYDPSYKKDSLILKIFSFKQYPHLKTLEAFLKWFIITSVSIPGAILSVVSVLAYPITAAACFILSPITLGVLKLLSVIPFFDKIITPHLLRLKRERSNIVEYLGVIAMASAAIIPFLLEQLFKNHHKIKIIPSLKKMRIEYKLRHILKDNYDQFISNLDILQSKKIDLTFNKKDKGYTLLDLFSNIIGEGIRGYNEKLVNNNKQKYSDGDIKSILLSLLKLNLMNTKNLIIEIIVEYLINKNPYLLSYDCESRQDLLKTNYKDGIIYKDSIKFLDIDNKEIVIPIIIKAEQIDKIVVDYFDSIKKKISEEYKKNDSIHEIESIKQEIKRVNKLIEELRRSRIIAPASNKIDPVVLKQYRQLNADIAFIAAIKDEIRRLNILEKTQEKDIFYNANDYMTPVGEAANKQSKGESSTSSIPKSGWKGKNFSGFNFKW